MVLKGLLRVIKFHEFIYDSRGPIKIFRRNQSFLALQLWFRFQSSRRRLDGWRDIRNTFVTAEITSWRVFDVNSREFLFAGLILLNIYSSSLRLSVNAVAVEESEIKCYLFCWSRGIRKWRQGQGLSRWIWWKIKTVCLILKFFLTQHGPDYQFCPDQGASWWLGRPPLVSDDDDEVLPKACHSSYCPLNPPG